MNQSLSANAPSFQPGAVSHRFARPEEPPRRQNNRNRNRNRRGRGRGRGKRGKRGNYRRNRRGRGFQDRSMEKEESVESPRLTAEEEAKKVEEVTLPYDISDKGTVRCKDMTREIMANVYNCVICLAKVERDAKIWNCGNCYAVFHLDCILDWKKSLEQQEDVQFRCPACQNSPDRPTFEDRCFCGRDQFPALNTFLPHSCGNQCSRVRPYGCPHPCPLQCHPGPCSPCPHKGAERTCACGKMTYRLQCGTTKDAPRTCEEMCGKPLSCGKHFCTRDCHNGPCDPCEEHEEQTCFCGKKTEMRTCGTGAGPLKNQFFCGEVCNKKLDCGNHFCKLLCHDGPCPPCDRKKGFPQRCACGTEMLQRFKRRRSCLDPLPSCKQICNKLLACGNPEHVCKMVCHDSECPPCDVKVKVACVCGRRKERLICSDVAKRKAASIDGTVLQCKNKCGVLMSCRRHRCQEMCCMGRQIKNYEGHLCTLLCDNMLPCGKHMCDSLCHSGKCPPCSMTLREGISCTCGAWFHPGPVRCGSVTPDCRLPCSKVRECGHPCPLKCHFGPCPPCTVLVSKWCAGRHKKLQCVRCHQNPRCEQKCGRLRVCGIHKCKMTCHAGPCDDVNSEAYKNGSCGQECGLIMDCGHRCPQLCHPDQEICDSSTCKKKVYITCPCGRRQVKTKCFRKRKIKILVCDDKCIVFSRNARFREALNIDTESVNLADYRIATEILNTCDGLRNGDDFVKMLENALSCFVKGKPVPKSKGLDQIGDTKLEISQLMNKEKVKIIKAIAPNYGLKVELTGALKYKFTSLIRGPSSSLPPVSGLLSDALAKWRENPDRYHSTEVYPPERIVVLNPDPTTPFDPADVVTLLHGLNVIVEIHETTDNFRLLFFEDSSMRDASFPLLQKKYGSKTRKGIDGDSSILYISNIKLLYSTKDEMAKKRAEEIRRTHPRSQSGAFKSKPLAREREEEVEAANPFQQLMDADAATDV